MILTLSLSCSSDGAPIAIEHVLDLHSLKQFKEPGLHLIAVVADLERQLNRYKMEKYGHKTNRN